MNELKNLKVRQQNRSICARVTRTYINASTAVTQILPRSIITKSYSIGPILLRFNATTYE